ncbi:uncharacterized protein LOC122009555 [Zingiber officinale]|uniref:uncharacterized protein LOC122009555 n=1 Tax=Zingiber officinale TaxID=94328 RepID=UPI001C4B8FD0|nr:uncharacterized protein LOC122009555 [Zingiber officinale]
MRSDGALEVCARESEGVGREYGRHTPLGHDLINISLNPENSPTFSLSTSCSSASSFIKRRSALLPPPVFSAMVFEGHHHIKVGLCIPSNDSCAPAAAAAIKFSKKSRLNKTPQSGLGVAQLERLRYLEEQDKNGGDASSSLDPSQPFGLSPPPARQATSLFCFLRYTSGSQPPNLRAAAACNRCRRHQ